MGSDRLYPGETSSVAGEFGMCIGGKREVHTETYLGASLDFVWVHLAKAPGLESLNPAQREGISRLRQVTFRRIAISSLPGLQPMRQPGDSMPGLHSGVAN